MTALRVPRKITIAEYLLIEANAEIKSEFYQGEMFAMAGASPRHNRVFSNLFLAIGKRLEGHECLPFPSDQRLRIFAPGLYTYPDMMIACKKPVFDPRDEMSLINPTVIFEILSPSTEAYDRGKKLDFYHQVESAREIVHVWQDEPRVEVHLRTPHDDWGTLRCAEIGGEFHIPSIPLSIPLAEVYRNVDFSALE